MYEHLKDAFGETVTLEQLVNVAGELLADCYDDFDERELWNEDQRLLDSFEGIIRYLFKIDDMYIMEELTDAIEEAGNKASDLREKRRAQAKRV